METAIEVALITAVVTAIGWLVVHYLSQKRDRENTQKEAALRHVERQLEELYGPLTFLIHEGRRTYADLLENLERDHVFEGDEPLPEDEQKMWLFWIENSLMPKNEKIRQLLMSKTHLIDGSRFPDSYVTFLDHHNSWTINHLRWKEEGIPYRWRSKIDWPKPFDREVLDTFKKFKGIHARLLGELEGSRF